MPTKKPRMQISMLPEDFQFFKEFGALQGLPASTLIAQYLHEGIPVFRQLAQAMQELKKTDFSVMTDKQRARLKLALDGGIDSGQSALLMLGDAVQSVGAAVPRKREPQAKSGGETLIHRNKVPKPRPATVPAGSRNKTKGAKRAPT